MDGPCTVGPALTSGYTFTTKHPEAHIFNTKEEAIRLAGEFGMDCDERTNEDDERISNDQKVREVLEELAACWLVEVEDEIEFKNREDTW